MEVGARQSVDEDAAALRALRARAADEVRVQRGGRRLLAAPDDPHERVRFEAVATIDGVVVGYADVALVEEAGDALICRVASIYVEPEAREVGAAEELLGVVLEFAERSGATAVDALVLPGQRETKNFFESAGFAARLIVMNRPFGPADQAPASSEG